MTSTSRGRGPDKVAATQKRHFRKVPGRRQQGNREFDRMVPVTRQNPCPVCESIKWCLIAPDGSAVICPKVSAGSVKKCGEAGHLHILKANGEHNRQRSQHRSYRKTLGSGITSGHVKQFTILAEQYSKALTDDMCRAYAEQLGVSPEEALRRLHVGWMDHGRYSWPMYDTTWQIIGIRVRTSSGKYCVPGSRTGLFLPQDLSNRGVLLICEGNTDAAAGLSLGFETIGRPSCSAGADMLETICHGRDIVIVSDRDEKPDGSCPGLDGATRLAEKLVFSCPSVKTILPPQGYKDLRGWLRAGLNRDALLAEIEQAEPLTLEVVR